MMHHAVWPVLKTYAGELLRRVAMPIGGIGTGTVSLGGRGDLRDWEIMNRSAKGFIPESDSGHFRGAAPFFALHVREGERSVATLGLEGPLDSSAYEGPHGCRVPNHGLPRFRGAEFDAAYPLATLRFYDPDVPVRVRLEAFNPLIPTDPEASGLPVAVLRYVLDNPTERTLTATVCGNVPNFIGVGGTATVPGPNGIPIPAGAKANRNTFRREGGLAGIMMRSDGVASDDPAWGTMALTAGSDGDISYRTAWAEKPWGGTLLDFWDDLSADGALEDRKPERADKPMASLAVRVNLPPGETRAVTFMLSWHFPNRRSWNDEAAWIGNYYCTRDVDAWAVAARVWPALDRLERETVGFVRAFCESSLPEAVKEAALFNLSTLRTQTCFRTPDGRFFGYEGCNDCVGCCHGSCTHVWNYEAATALLFGSLARSMREVEFAQATAPDGRMAFRVHLPIARAQEYAHAAADGQMGCIIKLYREWQLSGDDGFLKMLWPHARRALEYCWVPGGWDADCDGVMEGCQHNTMDVEYFGPNPQMTGWYLGALRAAEAMARHLGDLAFAATCGALFARGSAWMDANLFNGEYYEHRIQPPADPDGIPAALWTRKPEREPILQLGAGCLVDQLAGQYLAQLSGLGELHDRGHVRKTLGSIWRHNRKRGFRAHFNNARSYVLGDESGLLMCTYPRGRRPELPFPYYTEVMTGFEYTAAVGMIQEGLVAEGLACIRDIRDRYDGRKRNPFNEAECGHHYARAMASWGAVTALTGFQYSAVTGRMRFAVADGPVTWFWSTGDAWGTVAQGRASQATPLQDGVDVQLRVLGGRVVVRELVIGERMVTIAPDRAELRAGDTLAGGIP